MRIASLAAAASLVTLAACSSPNPVLYTIAPASGTQQSGGPKVVALQQVSTARYLERSEIVRSSESYRLDVMSNDWWGEPLGSMLSRVIILGLSQRLPNSKIYPEGGAISVDPNAVLGVNIQRLDLDAAGSLVLEAQAAVEFNRPTRSASMSYRIVKAPAVRGVAGQVAAASDAVGELTDGLATLLQS